MLLQKFRQINACWSLNWFNEKNCVAVNFTKKNISWNQLFSYLLLSRDFYQKSTVRENFHNFHTVFCRSHEIFVKIVYTIVYNKVLKKSTSISRKNPSHLERINLDFLQLVKNPQGKKSLQLSCIFTENLICTIKFFPI